MSPFDCDETRARDIVQVVQALAAQHDAATNSAEREKVSAEIVRRFGAALLSSPRAPESTLTEGDPEGVALLKLMPPLIRWCRKETLRSDEHEYLDGLAEKVRAYLSSREQPQEKK